MTLSKQEPPASPLGPTLERFAKHLEAAGYTKSTGEQYLSICRKFDRHLGRAGVDAGEVREEHVEVYLARKAGGRHLRERGRIRRRCWRKPILLLLEQLRREGVIPRALSATRPSIPELDDYLTFLREHRGFCERTVNRRELHIRRLLADVPDLRLLTIDQVDRHLVRIGHQLRRQSIGAVCSSLRGFLAHLHMRGILPVDLRRQVTTPRIYPLESMPRAVAWSEIERTLASIDRSTAIGCRDHAMLMLIAYCGLRAGDVVALRLEDLDWRRDVIHVRRPKKKTTEPVPLVPAVGEALIAYLRHRPKAPYEEVFLKCNAPIAPLQGPRVSWRAYLYLRRAGVKAAKLGSHTLRHSFAVEMLRRGHSPRAIGDVLGHDHPQSSFLYMKGAVDDLRGVTLGIEEVAP